MNSHTNDLAKIIGFDPEKFHVSKGKVSNMKNRYGNNLIKEHNKNTNNIECLGFDGKKSYSKAANSRQVMLDKYTVVSQPESKYIDHFVPKNGFRVTIANELYALICKYDSEDSLRALLCDGCRTNTGADGGAIRLCECNLNSPVQWIVCLLHQNELPFRHLFFKIDGKAQGPESFTGSIGKLISAKDGLKLETVENSCNFEPIAGKVPKIDYELENNDLKYLYKICHLIQDGPAVGDLSILKEIPGKVNLGRWVTLASNLCREYCQTKKCPPTKKNQTRYTSTQRHYHNLKTLVKIILNIYAPMCFNIRKRFRVTDGSKLLFEQLQLAKDVLQPSHMTVFKEVFKNNCYFAHPENMLLCMMFDEDEEIKKKALKLILDARKRAKKSKKLRKFILPKKYLNFQASHYHELLLWDKMKPREITDPPLLRKFSDDDLKQFSEGVKTLEKFDIPCHSQSVERLVALTSSAATSDIGYTKRHSNILNKQNSFKKFKTKFTKTDFV